MAQARGRLLIKGHRKTLMGGPNWRESKASAPQDVPMQFCAHLGCFLLMAAISSKLCCACQKATTSSALLTTRLVGLRPHVRLPQRACRSRSSCAKIRTKPEPIISAVHQTSAGVRSPVIFLNKRVGQRTFPQSPRGIIPLLPPDH